jgi:hypothetical protein
LHFVVCLLKSSDVEFKEKSTLLRQIVLVRERQCLQVEEDGTLFLEAKEAVGLAMQYKVAKDSLRVYDAQQFGDERASPAGCSHVCLGLDQMAIL